MPADRGGGFMLEDEDRLPWLEPAEPVEDMPGLPLRKVILLVLLMLVLLGVLVGGGWWYMSRDSGEDGDVTLIAAPSGPFKIPASEAAGKDYKVDGKTFDGTGDETYATSAGGNAMGRIDASKGPETPITDMVGAAPRPAAPAPAKPAPKPTASPTKGGTSARIADATAPKPAPRPAPVATPAPAPSGTPAVSGPQIQLGAYNSESIAEAAWTRLGERFDELSGAKHRVEPVVSGGKTLYRLRMGVADGAAGKALCDKLRVAGESCWAVK
jgi:hypothetical protein